MWINFFSERFSITPIAVLRGLSFQIAEVMEEEGVGNFGFVEIKCT